MPGFSIADRSIAKVCGDVAGVRRSNGVTCLTLRITAIRDRDVENGSDGVIAKGAIGCAIGQARSGNIAADVVSRRCVLAGYGNFKGVVVVGRICGCTIVMAGSNHFGRLVDVALCGAIRGRSYGNICATSGRAVVCNGEVEVCTNGCAYGEGAIGNAVEQACLSIVAGNAIRTGYVGARNFDEVRVGVIRGVGRRAVVVALCGDNRRIDGLHLDNYRVHILAPGGIGYGNDVFRCTCGADYVALARSEALVPFVGVGRSTTGSRGADGRAVAGANGLVCSCICRKAGKHEQGIIFHFAIAEMSTCGAYTRIVMDVEARISHAALGIGRHADGKYLAARGGRTRSAGAHGEFADDFFRGVEVAIAVEINPAVDIGICIIGRPADGDVFGGTGCQFGATCKGHAVFVIGAVVVVAIGIGRRLGTGIGIRRRYAQPGRRTCIGNDAKVSVRSGVVAIVALDGSDGTGVVFHFTFRHHARRRVDRAAGQAEAGEGGARNGIDGYGVAESQRLWRGA